MLNFVLCDDNKSILDKLSKMLESIFINNSIDATVSYTSTSPDEVLNYSRQDTADVLFLDIDLKSSISGIDLANSIRKFNKNAYIIFTSAHLEYILIAYKCKTFDFIPKPFSVERIEETVLRLVDDASYGGRNSSFIRIDNKNTIINEDNINYIKKDGMKLVFYTDDRTYETYNSFNKISSELPENFVRCHKSYIANINKITNVNTNDNSITFNSLSNDKIFECSIGAKYKNNFMEVMKKYGNISNNLDSINNRK